MLPRFVALDDEPHTFVALEEVIAANLDALFPGMEIVGHGFFRVTRDADFEVSDEADDLLQAVEAELRRRRFGEAVRLEVDVEHRSGRARAAARGARPRGAPGLRGRRPARPRRPVADLRPARLRRAARPAVDAGHPAAAAGQGVRARQRHRRDAPRATSSSTTPTTRSRRRSSASSSRRSADPDVLAIKQTVYRTSDDSPLVPALIRATERGKQAVCMVELKARFDERANIGWARALEQAGVHVVYGYPGPEDARQVHPRRAPRGRRRAPLRPHRHRQLPPEDRAPVHRLRPVHLRRGHRQRRRRHVQLPHRLRAAAAATARCSSRRTACARGSSSEIERDDRRARARRAGADPHEDELARRPALHPRAVPRLAARACRSSSTCAASAACARAWRASRRTSRVVSVLGRFLEHSRIYSFERDGETARADRLGRPHAAQPRHARRARHAGRGRRPARTTCSTRSTARWRPTNGPGSCAPTARWRKREPGDPPRSVQRELMTLHAARASEAAQADLDA